MERERRRTDAPHNIHCAYETPVIWRCWLPGFGALNLIFAFYHVSHFAPTPFGTRARQQRTHTHPSKRSLAPLSTIRITNYIRISTTTQRNYTTLCSNTPPTATPPPSPHTIARIKRTMQFVYEIYGLVGLAHVYTKCKRRKARTHIDMVVI